MAQNKITVFKIKNRSGYAAICNEHLTEGKSREEALARMVKALNRTAKKKVKNHESLLFVSSTSILKIDVFITLIFSSVSHYCPAWLLAKAAGF